MRIAAHCSLAMRGNHFCQCMRTLFARIAFDNHRATALALMNDNDVLQTKFIGTILDDVPRTFLSDTFINISFDTIDGMWTTTGGGGLNL